MKLAKSYRFLKKDLSVIEESLTEAIQADHPILRQASTQLLEAGGKRIRPIFVLLSSQLNVSDIDQVKEVAATLELIHMATLVHDDVIDESELRRGMPTIKTTYGNKVAMYTGDYILARSLEKISEIKDPRVHQILSNALVGVCVGEIEQIKDQYNVDQPIWTYFRRIKRKTALLIATSCQLGAIVGGASDQVVKQMYTYGYCIGMSYQMIDDILDFTATERDLGKPTGNDLVQGNITLPIFFAKRDHAFHQLLTTHCTNEIEMKAHIEPILSALHETDAIEQSYAVSDQYLQKALDALTDIPESRAKKTLYSIATYIGRRRS